jgi:hypothetical protein
MAERRRVPRYQAELKARVLQASEGLGLPVKVTTLSVAGCCVRAAESLKAQQECVLAIEWEGKQLRVESMVTWKSSRGEAGLKFTYLDEANQELLRTICSTLHLQPLVHRPEERD